MDQYTPERDEQATPDRASFGGGPNFPEENGRAAGRGCRFATSVASLIASAGMGLWEWDLTTGEMDHNHQLEVILSYSPSAHANCASLRRQLIYQEDLPEYEALLSRCIAGQIDSFTHEYRVVRGDGSTIWLQEHCAVTGRDASGKPTQLTGMMSDISAIKHEAETLRAESEHREAVARMAGLGNWEWDATNDIFYLDETYQLVTGYEPQDLRGTIADLSKVLTPEHLGALMQRVNALLKERHGTISLDMEAMRKGGGSVWLRAFISVVEWDIEGRPTRLRGGIMDIDEEVRAKQKLQAAIVEVEGYNDRLRQEVSAAIQRLHNARHTMTAMFEASPFINVLVSDRLEMIDCNPMALAYFGFADKAELRANIMPLIQRSIPPRQPDGHPSVPLEARLRTAIETGYAAFETELYISGKLRPFRAVFKRIPYEDSFAIVVFLTDLSESWEAKNELLRKDRLLQAVNASAELLMGAKEPEDEAASIYEVLSILGKSVDADRAYIWRNVEHDGRLCCLQYAEWSQENPSDHHGLEGIPMPYDDYFPGWRDLLDKSLSLTAADMDDQLASFPGMQDVQSLLLLPVMIKGEFWGFIGFDDTRRMRRFSDIEADILCSGGMVIAASIIRGETTRSLIEAREAAVRSMHAKSEFLSRMSHEIRTPMNAIIGMTTVAKKASGLEKIRACLGKIEVSSRQLLALINDVLDMSKIDSGKFEISESAFNFERMLENVINVMLVKFNEKHQRFTLDIDKPITRYMISDELRLSQVLTNLLSNAGKFTPDFGEVTLAVRDITPPGGASPNESRLRIDVIDSGIGIAKEAQARLFDSFSQADTSITRRFGGTGLGLAICKKIVALLGGDIQVSSEEGSGADFFFEINVKWGKPLARRQTGQGIAQGMRMLAVDDNEDVLEYFCNVLSGFSLPCDVAAGGQTAVAMARLAMEQGKPYHIVFLDWQMPGMNGEETARALQELMGDELVIVLISVVDWQEIEPKAAAMGIKRFLPKPVLPSALYNMLVELTNDTMVTDHSPQTDVPASYDWRGKRILLVEDIEINREILISIVEETGVQVDTAENGAIGVEMFKRSPDAYDLILMDVQMPVMDGLAATSAIRASGLPGASTAPIVAMTANAFKEDELACRNAGMNDHIGKPLEVEKLFAVLGRYLGQS